MYKHLCVYICKFWLDFQLCLFEFRTFWLVVLIKFIEPSCLSAGWLVDLFGSGSSHIISGRDSALPTGALKKLRKKLGKPNQRANNFLTRAEELRGGVTKENFKL